MPRLILTLIESRWFRVAFIIIWALSLLFTIERSWVSESGEWVQGELVAKRSFFEVELDRRPTFAGLTVVLLGYLAFEFKRWRPAEFGLTELMAGILGAFITLSQLTVSDLSTWLGLIGALYLVASGIENMREHTITTRQPRPPPNKPLKLTAAGFS